jgi:hypothetical protein
MSNPDLPGNGTVTATIQSNVPDTPASVTANYKTTTSTFGGGTDSSGTAAITFNIASPTAGFTVVVDANVGGASCSTSFTPT